MTAMLGRVTGAATRRVALLAASTAGATLGAVSVLAAAPASVRRAAEAVLVRTPEGAPPELPEPSRPRITRVTRVGRAGRLGRPEPARPRPGDAAGWPATGRRAQPPAGPAIGVALSAVTPLGVWSLTWSAR
jgi:hypothetical protein